MNMNQQHIESILLANWYFTTCKLNRPNCNKTELARKYLSAQIKKALSEMNNKNEVQKDKALFNFKLF